MSKDAEMSINNKEKEAKKARKARKEHHMGKHSRNVS